MNAQWKLSLNHIVLIVLASVTFARHVRQLDQAHPPETRSHGQTNNRFALFVVDTFVRSKYLVFNIDAKITLSRLGKLLTGFN